MPYLIDASTVSSYYNSSGWIDASPNVVYSDDTANYTFADSMDITLGNGVYPYLSTINPIDELDGLKERIKTLEKKINGIESKSTKRILPFGSNPFRELDI
jgi:hypothetical protein